MAINRIEYIEGLFARFCQQYCKFYKGKKCNYSKETPSISTCPIAEFAELNQYFIKIRAIIEAMAKENELNQKVKTCGGVKDLVDQE